MRGVNIDCSEVKFTEQKTCEGSWSWLKRDDSAHGDDYLIKFEALFEPEQNMPPFIGVKIYPSLGYSPGRGCADVADAWKETQSLNEVAKWVAMAPLRNPKEWEGLPVPTGSGCFDLHEALMADLGARASEVKTTTLGDVEYFEDADFSQLGNRIQMVAFLRLTAEMDRVMKDFYTMTRKLDLPIIAHSSPEGFAVDDGYYQYGLTTEWGPVPELESQRILIAHAGGPPVTPKGKANLEFDEVIKFIKDKPYLFIDLSARDVSEWEDSVATLETVPTQVLYGSDWFMTTRNTDTDEFLRRHRRLFTRPEDYLANNALQFLAPEVEIVSPKTHSNRDRICEYLAGQHAPWLEEALSCPKPPPVNETSGAPTQPVDHM